MADDRVSLFDSTIILEYIEDRWPTPPLLRAGAADRARVRMMEEIMDTHFEAINWGLGEVNWFKRAEGELAETLRSNASARTAAFYGWLERQLGDRAWFNGNAFGWGDPVVAPFVAASASFGNRPATGLSLAAWLEGVLARPSVAETVKAATSIG